MFAYLTVWPQSAYLTDNCLSNGINLESGEKGAGSAQTWTKELRFDEERRWKIPDACHVATL